VTVVAMADLPRSRCWFKWSAAGCLAAWIGCTPAGPLCYPVRGQVSFEGKPVAEAMVVLHPLAGSVEGGQKPIATTDADGRFAMTTYRTGDGAPPGEYAITVELRATRMAGEELVRDGRNLLPARYAQPEKSGLRCSVLDGDVELPAIHLTRS
jgi:hypothetical protein